ncbi:hypothetical protein RZS08_24170, partial [Arthrospira platensis SPKY1]|nr:hypothetical protein [Arthrospira platensis SPKY1]
MAFYWGGAMVGRFLGAIALSGRKTLQQRAVQMLPIPALAVAVVVTVVLLNDLPLSMAGGFAILLGLNYLAFLFGKHTSQGLLAFFALCCMALLGVTMLGHGDIALWAVLGVGL